MAGTFSKRQKEQSRQQRQKEKLGRKRESAALKKQSTGSGPEIDWNHSQDSFGSEQTAPAEEPNEGEAE